MLAAEDIRRFSEAVISVFAIVNPVGSLPLLISLTEGAEERQRKRLVRIASLAAVGIICVVAIAGHFLLSTVFNLEIAQFTLGGGLILMAFGIQDILGARSDPRPNSAQAEQARLAMAVSPIACPMLVGPGAIVTTMLIAQNHGVFYALGACLCAFVFVTIILNFSRVLYRFLGPIATLAVARVMQIFIVAIGARFVINALKELFPAIASKG
jgi:multiple antibiotic resistance protein